MSALLQYIYPLLIQVCLLKSLVAVKSGRWGAFCSYMHKSSRWPVICVGYRDHLCVQLENLAISFYRDRYIRLQSRRMKNTELKRPFLPKQTNVT